MKRIVTAWRARTARERLLLTALAATLAAAALWLGLWQPLQEATDAQRLRQRHLIEQLRRLPAQPENVKDLPALLRHQAAAAGVALRGVEERDGRIKLTVATMDADALLAWLAYLETQYALRVGELDIHASTPADGQVHIATLWLEQRKS